MLSSIESGTATTARSTTTGSSWWVLSVARSPSTTMPATAVPRRTRSPSCSAMARVIRWLPPTTRAAASMRALSARATLKLALASAGLPDVDVAIRR